MARLTGSQIARRRAVAVGVAVAATVLIWFALISGGDSEQSGGGSAPGGEVPASVRDLVDSLSPDEKVDQVLLLGFDGTDAGAGIVAELRERQLGGVLVTGRNWIAASQLESLVGALRDAGHSGGRIPPLIAASQEGGPFRAFPDLPPAERRTPSTSPMTPSLPARFRVSSPTTCCAESSASRASRSPTTSAPVRSRPAEPHRRPAESLRAAALRSPRRRSPRSRPEPTC